MYKIWSVEWNNELINYLGDCNSEFQPSGFCEIACPLYRYIGNNRNFKPVGIGKKYYENGIIEEANYEDGDIHGQAVISKDYYFINAIFNRNKILNGAINKGQGSVAFTFSGDYCNFMSFGNSILYNELKTIFKEIWFYIEENITNSKSMYKNCSLNSFIETAKAKTKSP